MNQTPADDAAVEKYLTDLLTLSHVPYPEQLKFAVRAHVQDLLKVCMTLVLIRCFVCSPLLALCRSRSVSTVLQPRAIHLERGQLKGLRAASLL